jgi:hypothetical protein
MGWLGRRRKRKGARGMAMKTKLSFLLLPVALLVFGSEASQATTVDLFTTALGCFVDVAGGVADGTFDRTVSGNAEVNASGNFTYRAVMEFDLSSISMGADLDSQLHWTLGNSTNPPVSVQLYGYVGDAFR